MGRAGWAAIGSSFLPMVARGRDLRRRGLFRRPAGDAADDRRCAKVWEQAGIRDYDLEWTAAGMNHAHYFVTVRGGVVRKIESVAPDGRKFEVHPAEMRFYGVDGLFTTIADELAAAQDRIVRSASPREPRW